MQKSFEGLLRALLHTVLLGLSESDRPEACQMLKRICENRWQLTDRYSAWSCLELKQMLARLSSLPDVKILFLIDALDECEPQDRLDGLGDEIIWISRLPNTKVCVSCRPWLQFTQRFKDTPTLRLDQLTHNDMEIYITQRLVNAEVESDVVSTFRKRDITARWLIHKVAHAAEGVFLWVELVTKALCSEVRKNRTIEELGQIIAEFPTGLDQYFHDLIFGRIGRSQRNLVDTAAVLKLAMKISLDDRDLPCPQSFWNFWLLKQRHIEAGFSWNEHDHRWLPLQETEEMMRQTRSYLEETCKDLLVLHEEERKVDFLHRTVFDFLVDSSVGLLLEQRAPFHFEHDTFIIDLAKLRVMYLLREEHPPDTACVMRDHAELIQQITAICLYMSKQDDDLQWIEACDNLIVTHSHIYCRCDGMYHLTGDDLVRCCLEAGLCRSVLVHFSRLPHKALSKLDQPEFDFLGKFLAVSISTYTRSVYDSNLSMALIRHALECGCDPNATMVSFHVPSYLRHHDFCDTQSLRMRIPRFHDCPRTS